MVTIGMNYLVIPGKEEIFENAFRGVIKVMADIEGHSETKMFRNIDNLMEYSIVSDWSSEDAFNGFMRSEQFAKVANWGKEQILAGRPSHTVYKR